MAYRFNIGAVIKLTIDLVLNTTIPLLYTPIQNPYTIAL